MKSCLLLIVLITVCRCQHIPPTYGFTLLLDSSEKQKDLVRAVKMGAEELTKGGARMFRDYAAVAFHTDTIQSSNPNHFREHLHMITPHPVNASDLEGFEYYQMHRAIELSPRDSVIFYFTDTIHNFNDAFLEYAKRKNVVIHIFLTKCCLHCSSTELHFREHLKREGHAVYCIMLSDIDKIFNHTAKITANLRTRAEFEALLRKRSLTFAVDISRDMKSQFELVKKGVVRVVNEAPANVLTFAVFSWSNVYKLANAAAVRSAFSVRFLNSSSTQAALNDRVLKSVRLSEKGSVVFSISRKLTLLPNSSVLASAKAKDVVIHFFLTNCCPSCPNEVKPRNFTLHGYGVFCITSTQLSKLMHFLDNEVSVRPFNLHRLRDVDTFIRLFRTPKAATTAKPSTTARTTAIAVKAGKTGGVGTTRTPKTNTGTTAAPPQVVTQIRYVGVKYVQLPTVPAYPVALQHPIIINTNITIDRQHYAHPRPAANYVLKCGSSSLQVPASALFLGWTIAQWSCRHLMTQLL